MMNKDAECVKLRGYQYHYDPQKRRSKKFDPDHCILQTIPPYEEDIHGRFLKNVKTPYQCDQLQGVWNQKCWKTEKDNFCFDKGKTIATCNSKPGCRWESNTCVNEKTIKGFLLPKDWPKDLTNGTLQDYLSRFYENKLEMPFPKSQELISSMNRCVSGSSVFTVPQNLLRFIMYSISNHETNRGLLVYHSTGSGKTVTAMAMIDSLWDTKKNIVISSSVEGKANNPITRYFEVAQRFLPRFQDKTLEEIERMFELRGIKYFSFAELSHFLLLHRPLQRVLKQGPKAISFHSEYLKNGVILIDEVHNIFRPLPTQKQENEAIKNFLLEDRPTNQNMKIVILTATPGNTIQDSIDLLNMIRDRSKPSIVAPSDFNSKKELTKFKRSIRGLVSFFDMSSDLSKFPKVYYKPAYILPMSHKQYEIYKKAKEENDWKENDYSSFEKSNALEKYMKTARKYSNSLYVKENETVLQEFSTKAPKLLSIINQFSKEKQYIYTAFYENRGFGGHGAVMIGKLLEQELGFTRFTCNEAFEPTISKAKRYIILSASFLTSKRSKSAAKNLQALMNIYNAPENAHGEYIQVIIASQGYNEGLDLKSTRHIHLFDPLVTYAMEKQTIGRAVRQCSHIDLNKELGQWTVQIHRYFADHPEQMDIYDPSLYHQFINQKNDEIDNLMIRLEDIKGKRGSAYRSLREEYKESLLSLKNSIKEANLILKRIEDYQLYQPDMIDEIIFQESRDRMKDLLILHQAIKDSAIDCKVLKDFHQASGIEVNCSENPTLYDFYRKILDKTTSR